MEPLMNKVLTFFLILLVLAVPVASYADTKNYQVKAVFLFKFFKYITWPDGTDYKTICVYGANPFGTTLDYIIKNKFSNAGYKVRYVNSGASLERCNIIFINESSTSNLQQTLGKLQAHKGILTVSDANGFARLGGGIEFVDNPTKIGLLLNTDAFNSMGLSASSKLMKVVETIE